MNREYYRQRAPRAEIRTFAGWSVVKPLFRSDTTNGHWILRNEYCAQYVRWLRRWMRTDTGQQWLDQWRHDEGRLVQLTQWRRVAGRRPRAGTVRTFLGEIQLTWRHCPPGNRLLTDDERRELSALLVGWSATAIGQSVVQTWRHNAAFANNIRRWSRGLYPPSADGVIAFLRETTGDVTWPITSACPDQSGTNPPSPFDSFAE